MLLRNALTSPSKYLNMRNRRRGGRRRKSVNVNRMYSFPRGGIMLTG